MPPGNGAPEAAIIRSLEEASPGADRRGRGAQDLVPRLRRRGITAVFSDFFDDIDAVLQGVRRLVHEGHEPILFQVVDPLEESFDLDALVKLEGLEGTGNLKIDPKAIREAYLEEIRAHTRELAQRARALSVDFVHVVTNEPLDAVLSAYLSRRLARARSRG